MGIVALVLVVLAVYCFYLAAVNLSIGALLIGVLLLIVAGALSGRIRGI